MGLPRTPPIERARADDVLQLAVDQGGRVPMAIGALLVLDPHAGVTAHDLTSALLARAAAVPRLGQRLVRTPPGAGRPVWLDAGSTALGRRVDTRVVTGAPPAPGSWPSTGKPDRQEVSRALLDGAADLVLTRLPADAPLWRARVLLDGQGGVAGVAVVAHHALVDGMGGLAVLGALADPPGFPAAAPPRHPPGGAERPAEPLPSWGALARDAWARRAPHVRTAARGGRRLARGADELGLHRPRPADRCSLLGPTGDRRRLELASADLATVRARAHAQGATVNDVVVTAVTGALVELLARRGEQVREVVVSVPVSRRRQGAAVALGNETGVVPVRVPAVPDRQRRLTALVEQRSRVGAPGRGGSAALLTPAFRALAAVGAFQPFVDHQRLVHTFVTNVRGPAERLRLAGAEVTAVVPVAVNPGNVAVSFDVLSYAGTLGVTLVCDPGLVPESAWLADRVAAGLTASS